MQAAALHQTIPDAKLPWTIWGATIEEKSPTPSTTPPILAKSSTTKEQRTLWCWDLLQEIKPKKAVEAHAGQQN
ncbi:hypothetical protein VTN77DRAFT_6960 [Rasamsonia byssochlamydoides]|uniref:uncharacterized protein n=1 Tax=Rasamsonia byssochlamydoides TaxID=89139 RepID=UPI0037449137